MSFSLNNSLEGDYLKFSQNSCNSHAFSYNSHQFPIITTRKFTILNIHIKNYNNKQDNYNKNCSLHSFREVK